MKTLICLSNNSALDCNISSYERVSLFHINIQCLSNKVPQLTLFLNEFKYDVVCLSEHWMNEESLKHINLGDYFLANSFSRSSNIHGGVTIFLKNYIECVSLNLNQFNSELNSEFCGVKLSKNKMLIFTLYRSCAGDPNKFLVNLEKFLFKYSTSGFNIVLVGDFNVNFHKKSSLSLVDSFGLDIVIKQSRSITT